MGSQHGGVGGPHRIASCGDGPPINIVSLCRFRKPLTHLSPGRQSIKRSEDRRSPENVEIMISAASLMSGTPRGCPLSEYCTQRETIIFSSASVSCVRSNVG